jgi:hypothetical protein
MLALCLLCAASCMKLNADGQRPGLRGAYHKEAEAAAAPHNPDTDNSEHARPRADDGSPPAKREPSSSGCTSGG